jgi:hypothetical protein
VVLGYFIEPLNLILKQVTLRAGRRKEKHVFHFSPKYGFRVSGSVPISARPRWRHSEHSLTEGQPPSQGTQPANLWPQSRGRKPGYTLAQTPRPGLNHSRSLSQTNKQTPSISGSREVQASLYKPIKHKVHTRTYTVKGRKKCYKRETSVHINNVYKDKKRK